MPSLALGRLVGIDIESILLTLLALICIAVIPAAFFLLPNSASSFPVQGAPVKGSASTNQASNPASSYQPHGPEMTSLATMRRVIKVVQGEKKMEGAGVRICRTVGTRQLKNLDPYLMLDELRCPSHQAAAGFPEHPHRGFETCSIMMSGYMKHEDSCGNKGKDLWGFQLWINLPKSRKMDKPRYQDYQAEDIPVVEADGVTVRVMAGTSLGAEGPIQMHNPGMLLDVRVNHGAVFTQPVPAGWNGFAYICDGSGRISGQDGCREQTLVLGPGDHIEAEGGEEGLRFLLVAGQPIGEPIVQYGPFVMNTDGEIQQAFHDYRTGRLQNPDDNPWAD